MSMLDEPVAPTLRRLSVPMGVGVVFMMLVNVIDTYWASQLSTDALAAMSFAFPVIGVALNISLGLMIGVSVAVSRALGEQDEPRARVLATHSLYLGLCVVAVISGAGALTIEPVFTMLGAPANLLPDLRAYMLVWYASSVFLIVPMMLNGVLRAHGDAIAARNVMILAAIFNGIFDPILIFGWGPVPALGLQGAALATGLSRAITFVYALVVAARLNALDLHLPKASEFVDSVSSILRVGIPATLTNVLGPVATAMVTAIIAVHGAAAVAAYGIGARMDALMLIPSIALSSGLSPFVGQNWGGHLPGRVREAVRLSSRFSIAWGVGAALVMIAAAPWIAAVFTDDPEVASGVVSYLRVVPIGYAAYGVLMMVSSAFNAVDHATRATVLSTLRSIVFAIPLAWIGSQYAGVSGVYVGLAASSLIAAAVGWRWMSTLLSEELVLDAPDPTDVEVLMDQTPEALRPATRALVERLALEGVELHHTRGDAVGFFVGNRELGHLHASGHVDVPLPPDVGDCLVAEGLVTPHRMTECGWYSRELNENVDCNAATDLLLLAVSLHRMCASGDCHDPLFEQLRVSGPLQHAVDESARRWRAAHPEARDAA